MSRLKASALDGKSSCALRRRGCAFLAPRAEHPNSQERAREDVMFGCLPLDGPHREGGLLAGLRTYLPLSRTTLTQQFFGSAPQISATLPQRHPVLRR